MQWYHNEWGARLEVCMSAYYGRLNNICINDNLVVVIVLNFTFECLEQLTAIVYKFIMVMDLSSLHYSFWVWFTLVADLTIIFFLAPFSDTILFGGIMLGLFLRGWIKKSASDGTVKTIWRAV
jgi:hypothetical protein